MIDFEKELDAILNDDPLGLLAVKPKRSSAIGADERLVASFEEINAFVQEHDHEPAKSRDISERKLYSRLKGLRGNPENAAALIEFDTFNLLGDVVIPEAKVIETIDDVLDDDILGLLDDDGPDIFQLNHVPKTLEMPSHIARRQPCKEFDQFEPLFKQIHAGLASGKKVMRRFDGERTIEPGQFFVEQGMLVLVANQGEWEKRDFGNYNARLLCIFENGTESNLLLRSLASALWKDENGRQVIDANQLGLFDDSSSKRGGTHTSSPESASQQITEDDNQTGVIYVLRSLSDDPQIKQIQDLYKIGFSRRSVADRIENAKDDPTYLMAEVMPFTEFQVFNVNPQKVENLLHIFFSEACLDVEILDKYGKPHKPREWFVVPQHVIATTVQLLVSGDIVHYRYDVASQSIEPREE